MVIKGGRPDNRHVVAHILVPDVNEAIDFYTRAFDGKERYTSTLPDGKFLHAHLEIGDSILMMTREDLHDCSDEVTEAAAGMPLKSPKTLGGSTVILERYVDDVDAAIKQAVDAGAEVLLPVSDQFYGDRYGMVTDPFGHVWAIATVKEILTAQEVDERALAQFTQT